MRARFKTVSLREYTLIRYRSVSDSEHRHKSTTNIFNCMKSPPVPALALLPLLKIMYKVHIVAVDFGHRSKITLEHTHTHMHRRRSLTNRVGLFWPKIHISRVRVSDHMDGVRACMFASVWFHCQMSDSFGEGYTPERRCDPSLRVQPCHSVHMLAYLGGVCVCIFGVFVKY